MYILLYYWYRQGEGEGGKGGPEASDCEGFPLASSRLAAGLVSPRLASPRLEKSSRLAVTVTVAAAVAVTELRLRFAVRGSGYVLRCVSWKERERERERESLAFPGNIYQYLNLPPTRPAGRILNSGQCPPMSSWLGLS